MPALGLAHGPSPPRRSVTPDKCQVGGHSSRGPLQQTLVEAQFEHIFGHGPVGRPLAAGHCHQPAGAGQHRVLAAQRLGVLAAFALWFHQGPQADPHAADIVAPGSASEVASRFIQDELQLLGEWPGFTGQIAARRVRGSQDQFAQPGNAEQDPAICRFGNHQSMGARQELAVDHDVDPLAGRHHRLNRPPDGVAVLLPQPIDPDAGGVDHAMRPQLEGLAGFAVLASQARHLAVLVKQAGRGAVVHHQGALGRRGPGQRQREPGVVELSIPVLDAAFEPLTTRRRQAGQRFVPGQEFGGAQPRFARQRVVDLQADTVERHLPELVRRHHERQRLRQVRGVAKQRAALVQRFPHQRDIALREVAHAAVNQLGGARRGALGEVVRFDQHHRKATRGGIQRHPKPGRAAAHDGHVPGFGLR